MIYRGDTIKIYFIDFVERKVTNETSSGTEEV